MSDLSETTQGEEIKWGELRSACARKDWRVAWEVVGVDCTGQVTLGEVYIFALARRVSAVSAALRHWYLGSLRQKKFGDGPYMTWPERYARIKGIAIWESRAAAQFVRGPSRAARTVHDYERDVRVLALASLSADDAIAALPGALHLAAACNVDILAYTP